VRGVRGVLAILLTLGLTVCASVQPGVSQGPRAERPTYALGEKWIRSDGEYELIRIEKDHYIFSAGAGREIELTKDLAIAKVRRGKDVMAFDPPPKLTWPLEVGKSGIDQVTWYRSWNPAEPATAAFSWKVEAYEDVQTRAGTFKAFRIVQTLRMRTQRGVNWERHFVIWYAPEVRQFVKAGGSGKTEAEQLRFLAFQVLAVDRPGPAPIRVALREPKDQARVTTEGITVIGKVTGGTGVARVAVTLNGVEVSRQDETATPKAEVALEIPIVLREGKNILLVTAADPGGATQQEARTLFYDKPRPAPPPIAPPVIVATPSPPAPSPPTTATPSPPLPPTPPTPAPPVVTTPPLPPLQVTLTSPQDQARVEQETIGLAGMVTGGKGVSRVVVSLNGVEVSRLGEQAAQRALALNLPIKLREGSNTLVVTAMEPDGTISQEVRAVHYEKRVPLSVAVRYPEDKSRLTDEEIGRASCRERV